MNDANNVWLHEYVHTRQAFGTTEDARWLTEGSADYLAALLTLQQDRIDYADFREQLARGTEQAHRDAVLSEPATWDGRGSNYRKGALVLGELDRRIRVASDGERALTTVLAELNRRDEAVSGTAFVDLVAAGDDDLAAVATRYTTTVDVPDPPSLDAHRAAFETDPAAVELGPLRATLSGPYRNRSVGLADGTPRRLAERPVVGETLTLSADLVNAGGSAGDYDVALRVDGEVVARRTGRLAAGASTTVTFDVAVAAGSRHVRLADRTLLVDGVDPASPSVSDLRVDPTAIAPGESTTITTTISAPDDRPAAGTIRFRVGERVVDERTVRLDAGERATVTATTAVDRAGTYAVGVLGGPTETVSVRRGATTTPERTATPTDGSPGAGAALALVGLCLTVAVGARRRR